MSNAELIEKAKDNIKAAIQISTDRNALLLLEEALSFLDEVA